jgi:hypothetical protein
MMPRPESRAELSSPEFLARMNQGPVVIMTVLPSGPILYALLTAAIFAWLWPR